MNHRVPFARLAGDGQHMGKKKISGESRPKGGRHPIGRIGIGQDVDSAELESRLFDDLAADTSIGYSLMKNG